MSKSLRTLNPLFEKRLRFVFMVVVNQLQVHVNEERVEELGQLSPVAVQHRLDELFQPAVVHLIQGRIPLLAVRREDDTDIRLVFSTCSSHVRKERREKQVPFILNVRLTTNTSSWTLQSGHTVQHLRINTDYILSLDPMLS